MLFPPTAVERAMQIKDVLLRAMNHGFYLAGDRSGLFTDGEEFDPVVMWERFGKFLTLTAPRAEVATAPVKAATPVAS